MPNGDVPGGTGPIGLAVSIGTLLAGLFGGSSQISAAEQAEIDASVARNVAAVAAGEFTVPTRAPTLARGFAGRTPIPTPAEGGPPLVTERFRGLPGPFVPEPDLPILQELGIPFPEPVIPFQPGPAPVPDVERFDMAVDAPLLSGVGGLPAIFQRTTPIIGGVLGGLAQDLISGFLTRAPQELGAGQIPARVAQAGRLCPPERPSTQILRRIFQNTGVRIKLTSAKALARQLGLDHAARCLGVTITELCTLVITPSPRRRRGISGSDIRIVKRTARRFQSLQEDLSGLVSRRRAAPRRRPRHVHALAHTAPGA